MQSTTYKFYQGKYERAIANLGLHKLEIGDLVYIPGIGRGKDSPHFSMVVKKLVACDPALDIRINVKVLCQWVDLEGRIKSRWTYFEWLRKVQTTKVKSFNPSSSQLKIGDLVYFKPNRYPQIDQLGNLALTASSEAKQMMVTALGKITINFDAKPDDLSKEVTTTQIVKCLMFDSEKEKIFEENFFVEGLELVTDIPYKRLGSQY